MAEKTINTNVPARTQEQLPAATREPDRYLIPAVDIFETEQGLTLVADLPGVDKDALSVKVEENVLTIRGKVTPRQYKQLTYNEFELLDYYRQFELGEMVDQSKIGAELRNGVLTLQLPKAEKAKPKQISVKVG